MPPRRALQLLPPRTRALADEPAFIARFGTSKAAHMLAAVAPTPLPLGKEAIEAHARSPIAAASSEAFPPEHFYIFDLGAVYERWRVWTTSLPRVTSYYAVKSQVQPRPCVARAACVAGHGLPLRLAVRD